jgi:hypothetical protein
VSHTQVKQEEIEMSYKTEIVKAISKFNGVKNPDAKHNTGRLLGEAYFWDEMAKYAKAQAEGKWATLTREGIIPEKRSLDPGEQEVASSPSFAVIAKVTQPVKRFDVDELAKLMRQSKYKVPESTTKELVDLAKVPTSPMVTMRVVERG